MSPSPDLGLPEPPPFPPGVVCVLDSSVLINIKPKLKPDEQWVFFSKLTELVESGHLAFPSQVVGEMVRARFLDMPGAWIAGPVRRAVRYREPSDETLSRVLAAAQLIDPTDDDPAGVADPYVAGMACEIQSAHPQCRVFVATDDAVDRMPNKVALTTACDRLGIDYWSCDAFLAWAQIAPEQLDIEDPEDPPDGWPDDE